MGSMLKIISELFRLVFLLFYISTRWVALKNFHLKHIKFSSFKQALQVHSSAHTVSHYGQDIFLLKNLWNWTWKWCTCITSPTPPLISEKKISTCSHITAPSLVCYWPCSNLNCMGSSSVDRNTFCDQNHPVNPVNANIKVNANTINQVRPQ